MWDHLRNFVPSPSTPEVSPTPPPQTPPSRFGATRILLAQDPDRPVISIREHKNDSNYNDYVVYITQFIRSEGTYYAELLTLLRTLTEASAVTIFISSPGGSLHTGAMIASAIRMSSAKITTVALGVVASSAALIWSHGHNRHVIDGAVVMFHMSSHGDWGNSQEVALQAANTVRYVKEVAIDPLVYQGLLTPEEAETIIDRRQDLWLDSTELNARLERMSHGQAA